MKIALFPKADQEKSTQLALEVIEFFKKNKIPLVVEDEKAKSLNAPSLSSVDPTTITMLITMGGDGSILRIAHEYSHLSAAILGINLGHLGFMADVQISDMIPGLQDLVNGEFQIQERLMLEGKFRSGKEFFAINDCVFHRSRNPSLVEITIYIDNLFLSTFQADGVIIATPNGSTAYSLAAGGPILSPEIDAVVITPICPHTISNRPIVLSPQREIRIEYVSSKEPIECNVDGFESSEMYTGDSIILKKSSRRFKLVNLNRIGYYSTLRHKLGWSVKLR